MKRHEGADLIAWRHARDRAAAAAPGDQISHSHWFFLLLDCRASPFPAGFAVRGLETSGLPRLRRARHVEEPVEPDRRAVQGREVVPHSHILRATWVMRRWTPAGAGCQAREEPWRFKN